MRHIKAINNNGFGLIELTVVIIIISVLAGIAMQSMLAVMEDTRQVKTEREMEMLAQAITGNPDITNNGQRSDFGYVGDIGAFPPNLQALYENPGSYTTWEGPYIETGFSQDSTGFKIDEWGTAYNYSGGITITSTGSGSNITKKIAYAGSDYLLNTFNGVITDCNDSLPGTILKDSIDIEITIPDGTGSTQTDIYNPDSTGAFILESLPVGRHEMRIIYKPEVDTLFRYLTILPRHKSSHTYKFAINHFSGSGGGGSEDSSGSETLRPEGAGTFTNLIDNPSSGSNWEKVDEVTADGNSSYVRGTGSFWLEDTYSTQNHSTGSGIIDSVVISIHCRRTSPNQQARTAIYTHSNIYYGSVIDLTSSSYTTYSTTYTTNPFTSSNWSWSEIDDMEIGIGMVSDGRCTQVWAEVFYTE